MKRKNKPDLTTRNAKSYNKRLATLERDVKAIAKAVGKYGDAFVNDIETLHFEQRKDRALLATFGLLIKWTAESLATKIDINFDEMLQDEKGKRK